MTTDGEFFEQLGEALTGWRSVPRSRQGSDVGGYRVGEPIGEGYYGTVYEATRAGEDLSRVAIKFIERRGRRVASGADAYFETTAASKLSHPNIARLLDVGVTSDDALYFVMELVRGERLDRFWRRRNLSLTERLLLFERLCRVVHHVHQHGSVLHLDLKPGNVLVTADGELKLLDFGLAQLLDELPQKNRQAPAHLFRGFTPGYAGPEQFRAVVPTRRSDVYSLGVILYQLVSDTLPIDVEPVAPYARAMVVGATIPQPPSEVDGSLLKGCGRRLRDDIDAIALKALRKRPEARYNTALDLADDVHRASAGLSILARKHSPATRVVRTIRRHPWGAAAVAAYCVLAVVGVRQAAQRVVQLQSTQAAARMQVDTARDLVRVGFTFLDGLARIPDTDRARLVLADRLVSSLDRLVAGAEKTDPSLDHELAERYDRLFTQYRDLQSSQQALRAIETAIRAHNRTDWMFEGAKERLSRIALLEEARRVCSALDQCAQRALLDDELSRLRGGQ
jgi:eukaryotic-like serine/threonine-protein kinase